MLGLMEERIEHRLPGVEKEEETLFLFRAARRPQRRARLPARQRNSSLASNGFYDVRQPQVTVNPMLETPLFGPLRGRIGARSSEVPPTRRPWISPAPPAAISSEATI